MKYNDAIDYLTRCSDAQGFHWYQGRTVDADSCPTCKGTNNAGHLQCPGSRYGLYSDTVAREVYRAAVLSRDTSASNLDHLMSDAVNDGDEVHNVFLEASGADIDAIVAGYLECQLWAQRDDGRADEETGNGPCLDANYGIEDISERYVSELRDEIAALVIAHPLAVRMYLNRTTTIGVMRNVHDEGQFGHDFYLTREHHGAGFWDRGLGDLGRYLTDISDWAGPATDLWDDGTGTLA